MGSYGRQKRQMEANRTAVLAALQRRGTASVSRLYSDVWECSAVKLGSKESRAGGFGLVTRILNRLEKEGVVESFFVGAERFWRCR